jgi:poly-gamma-glutamate synthesis protein (capsule biosynthesis protein)
MSGDPLAGKPDGRRQPGLRKVVLVAVVLTALLSPAQSQENEIILRFGGDCLLADHYERAVGEDVDRAFRELDVLASADVAMVNLECPVTTRGTRVPKPFNFRMRPEFLRAFTNSGVDIVNLANNHIYDYDSTGLFDTIRHLDSAGIRHTGAGIDKAEAHAPVVLPVKGKRIAFLGYYGGGEAPAATRTRAGVAQRALPSIISDIRTAREDSCADLVVVNLHWGVEKAVIPEPDQVSFARKVIAAGADVVVGHHPHVLQPVERFRSGIIAYSIGNLVFGGNSRKTYDTALLEIRIAGGKMEYSLVPIRVDDWSARLLEGPDGEELIRSLSRLGLPPTEY